MKRLSYLASLILFLLLPATMHAAGTNTLLWRGAQNRVDADFQNFPLPRVLQKISAATGWKIFIEPGPEEPISAKFKNLSEEEALRRLMGRFNYVRDQTNGISRLLVFATVSTAATHALPAPPKKNYKIANELLVKFKSRKTNSVDELARKLGAKIIGRNDKIGFYRLQFSDGTTADSAMQTLASNGDVAAVDSNYNVDPPTPFQITQTGAAGSTAAGNLFNLNPPNTTSGNIVGLIDTSVDPPDQFQKYMLAPVSVVGTPDPPTDQPSHGTAMLETMLSSMSSDPSMIQPVVVYSAGESTTTFDLMNGIIKAINLGDNPISISSGGTGDSTVFGDLIAEASQKGIQFVAAAGNTPGTEDTYPAAYTGVLAVTASAPNGQLAAYADDGSFVRAMEPGTSDILYNGGVWEVQGTSPATATMAGQIVALENQDHISATQAATRLSAIYPPPR